MTDNAVCLVTGATSGIGRATAQALAGMGRSVVILKQSAPSRIVNLTSTAFRRRRIDFADLQAQQRFEGMQAYCNSKLAVVLFTYELARRLAGTGVTANCVHPGVVRTNIGHGERVSLGWRVLSAVSRPVMRTPEEGAHTSVWAATAAELQDVSGRFFANEREARTSEASCDPELARRLWAVSAALVGLDAALAPRVRTEGADAR